MNAGFFEGDPARIFQDLKIVARIKPGKEKGKGTIFFGMAHS